MNTQLKQQILNIVGADCVIENAPMKDQITFRVGGPADLLVMPETAKQLALLLAILKINKVPYFLMGNGSNLLVRDGGYRGIIVKTRSMDAVEVKGNRIVAEAGAMLRKVAQIAYGHGLTGMEFASGIPGTIGGAVVMNAGAYGGEMRHIIESVDIITPAGEAKNIPAEECHFGYRHSFIQDEGGTVLRVHLCLEHGDSEKIGRKMRELNAQRAEKQPLDYPSAGSTFRRPDGYFAGKLIEDCGMKGHVVGGAAVSDKHAGFVINQYCATAKNITDLIEEVQNAVRKYNGVELKTEVIIIGED